jgi:regulator of protease activity HflC (stomatin/prohibitin superfamily)
MPLLRRIKRNYEKHRVGIWITLFNIAFILAYLAPRSLIFIDAGRAGVRFKRFAKGVQTDVVYGEGTHLIYPWDTMTVYDVRVSQTQSNFSVITSNGLSIRVEISVRFFPKIEYLALLHKQVGPNYVEKIVEPEIQASIRRIFGDYVPQDIYKTQHNLVLAARNEAASQLNERFIVLDDLLIKSIELPPTIQGAIQAKLVAEQASQEMEFRIKRERGEKDRKSIEAEGVSLFNTTVRETLTEELLRYKSIEAFLELAKYGNSNTIVFGGSQGIVLTMPVDQQRKTPPVPPSPLSAPPVP